MRLLLGLTFVFITGCQTNQTRSVIVDKQVRAEGKILADTIYDGLIKFYNIQTNKLMEQSYYKEGVQDGPDIQYNENGTVAVRGFFRNGKQHGYSYMYDEEGNLLSQHYCYYGIGCGNSMDYENQKLKSYWFYSLDNNLLMHLDYDSLKGRKLPEILSNFFFYNIYQYKVFNKNNYSQDREEYFLYTPNPPKFDFRYSLVLVDSTRKILTGVKEFSNTDTWSEFELDRKIENPNKKFALKLMIMDSINNIKIGALRVLK